MNIQDINLLKTICSIYAPSGNEALMKEFIIDYIQANYHKWEVEPTVYAGEEFQDCIVVVFGKPKTAVFAHMDSIGFTVAYNNELIPIGGPDITNGHILVGEDSRGEIEGKLKVDAKKNKIYCDFTRNIDRGTDLVFKSIFKETDESVQCAYLDNRLSIFVLLKLFETLKSGIIAFSCWEEHGGGSVPYLARFIYEKFRIKQALIADITWVTEGVLPGEGVAISMRDKSIPRKSFVNKIIRIATRRDVKFQLEVEGAGGSDGKELQASPYPFDWCFIGAPEDNVHTPQEIVNKEDIQSMIEIYKILLEEL